MTVQVDSVNMGGVVPRRYHHGDLRNALVEAAFELARERGPEAVVLREASRRVGVSHNAAYRHFAGRDELLVETCARCMSAFARLIERRVAEAPGKGLAAERRRLRASGGAYVEFALEEPGWFRTAFAVPPPVGVLPPGLGAGDSGLTPFELLGARLDAFAAAGGMPAKRRPGAEYAAWSAIHGLATLLIDGPLRGTPPAVRDRLLARVIETVERGL